MDHPREVSPLARAHRDDPTLTERFELVVAGARAGQRLQRAERPGRPGGSASQDEAKLQAGGDDEAEPVDDDYVEALEYGLPPTGGLGIGIDRLVMLISGAESIRDVILFPTLRPEGREERTARRPSPRRQAPLGVGVGGRVRRPAPAPRRGRPRNRAAACAVPRRPRARCARSPGLSVLVGAVLAAADAAARSTARSATSATSRSSTRSAGADRSRS